MRKRLPLPLAFVLTLAMIPFMLAGVVIAAFQPKGSIASAHPPPMDQHEQDIHDEIVAEDVALAAHSALRRRIRNSLKRNQ